MNRSAFLHGWVKPRREYLAGGLWVGQKMRMRQGLSLVAFHKEIELVEYQEKYFEGIVPKNLAPDGTPYGCFPRFVVRYKVPFNSNANGWTKSKTTTIHATYILGSDSESVFVDAANKTHNLSNAVYEPVEET